MEGRFPETVYDDLSGVRERVASRIDWKPKGLILDAGTGAGTFAFELAARFPTSNVLGVDRVPEYLACAEERRKGSGLTNASFQCADIGGCGALLARRFGLVATFLGLSDLLRLLRLSDALEALLACLSPTGGELVLVESFPELAASPQEEEGFSLNQDLGYVYSSERDILRILAEHSFEVKDRELFLTHRPPLEATGLRQYIQMEAGYCALDGSPEVDPGEIYECYRESASREQGLLVDQHVLMLHLVSR